MDSNTEKLLSLKNKHKNERCFILGMGPSLTLSDIKKLRNEITFACNKIYLVFDELDWRPTYYSVADHLVAQHNKEEIEKVSSCKIYSAAMKQYGLTADVWVEERGCDFNDPHHTCFAYDFERGWFGGGTVIYRQIQLAYYMGFKEIYLLGIDFSFNLAKEVETNPNYGVVLESNGEQNHFHKDYRKQGETWTYPKIDLQSLAFEKANIFLSRNGVKILNLSRETKLDKIPRGNLDDII